MTFFPINYPVTQFIIWDRNNLVLESSVTEDQSSLQQQCYEQKEIRVLLEGIVKHLILAKKVKEKPVIK